MEGFYLREAVVFLVAAGVVVPVLKRWRINPVLGFLVVGIVIGPFGLGRLTVAHPWLSSVVINDIEGVRAFAELGVIFLLFMIGLELSLNRLKSMRRLVFGLGLGQVLATALVIGLIARAFGNSIELSIVLGACLALSSTAIVMQLLTDQGRFGSTVGQGTFAVLLAQDIAVVPILFIVGAMATQDVAASAASLTVSLAVALAQAGLAITVILVAGRWLIRPLFRMVGGLANADLFMATTLLTLVATATITHMAGLSAALGAFLAGLILAETEFRHEVEVNIEPFKGLLLGLFFVSVGMGIDLARIAADPVWITLSVIGLFTIKGLILFTLARIMRFVTAQATEVALLLGQGGEFAFVVLGLAVSLGIVQDATSQFMMIVVSLTMFATPMVARGARLASEYLAHTAAAAGPATHAHSEQSLAQHVIIAGYGRTGQLLAELLDRQRVPHVGLDLDAERVRRMSRDGVAIYYGDAARRATLERAGISTAAAVVISTDAPRDAEAIVDAVRLSEPNLPVLVRVHDEAHGHAMMARGATQVVPEVHAAGLELAGLVLEHTGLAADAARRVINEFEEAAAAGRAGKKRTR